MTSSEYPELQVWNNAAFVTEESESSVSAMKVSWSDIQNSDCSKENLSPAFVKSPVSVKSSVPIKPLQSNGVVVNSHVKQFRVPQKPVLIDTCSRVLKEEEKVKACDERNIDLEIEELENEINRLSSRLKSLRLEKAERSLKTAEKRGRVIAAKFMEPKSVVKNLDGMNSNRRGLSLGPSEIYSRQQGKVEITPVQPIQNRRKSCFWKIQEIDEIKSTRGKWNSLSVSPKSRRTTLQAIKPCAATTVGSKRPVKKEDTVLGSMQPKRLFNGNEKSVPASSKKPLKPGRAVASRYNRVSNESRKRSLPENGKEEEDRCEKKIELMDMLPRIRTTRRCVFDESPRDSGPAKRVAELIGKKSFFSGDEEMEQSVSVSQALNFAEGEDEVND